MRAASICQQAGLCPSAPCAAGPRVRRSTVRMLRRARGELDSDTGLLGRPCVKYSLKACAESLLAVSGKQRALTNLDHPFRIARVVDRSAATRLPISCRQPLRFFLSSLVLPHGLQAGLWDAAQRHSWQGPWVTPRI